jgi:hypothetical protein
MSIFVSTTQTVENGFTRLSLSLLWLFRDEPIFNFFTRPRGFAQEREAGLYCRIKLETPDRDAPSHLTPTMPLHQLIDDAFQSDAVQWIARMRDGVRHKYLFF